MSSILVVDDEKEICQFLNHLFTDMGHEVTICSNGKEFDQMLERKSFQLAYLDVRLPDRNGLELLQTLRLKQPQSKAVVMTGYSTVKTAVEAIKRGANDFIEKPFEQIEELEALTEDLLNTGFSPTSTHVEELADELGCFIGTNEKMKQLFALAYKFAQKNVNVLIEGETGTGKEVLAHYIHKASLRQSYPFVAVNCGAISEGLLESELFGHRKGAFTGATNERKGFFELAGKGTLFLDEIGEASLSTQVKLLRVLETGEFMKVGGETLLRNKARLIAASHVDLYDAVEKGTFREDLLYRLDVVRLRIPPLRERCEDIPSFLQFYLQKNGLELSFSEDSLQCLMNYDWPGNVRELVNVIKRAFALADGETTTITPDYLPRKFLQKRHVSAKELPVQPSPTDFPAFIEKWQKNLLAIWKQNDVRELDFIVDLLKDLEVETTNAFIEKALKRTMGNREQAAKLLGITRRKLRYYMHEKNKN